MKKYLVALTLMLTLALPSCDTLRQAADDYLSEPTLAEISMGLKQALEFGISEGANVLSQRDGYYKSIYKILLPEEARIVTERLKVIPGFTNLEDIILEKLNRAAEDAAKSAAPIEIHSAPLHSVRRPATPSRDETEASATRLPKHSDVLRVSAGGFRRDPH